MTKEDGFRVLRGRGRGVWREAGGRRQEIEWDSWTNALGSLALSQSGDLETLDMLDVEAGPLDDESGLDLIVPYMWICCQTTQRATLCCYGEENRDSATGYSATMTWDLHFPEFWKTTCCSVTHKNSSALPCCIQNFIWNIVYILFTLSLDRDTTFFFSFFLFPWSDVHLDPEELLFFFTKEECECEKSVFISAWDQTGLEMTGALYVGLILFSIVVITFSFYATLYKIALQKDFSWLLL